MKKPFDKATFLRIETALTQPPPRPTDGFAFLLEYPPVTARVILQSDRRLEPTSPRDARYELALPVGVSLAGHVTDGVSTNISRSGIRLVTHTAILGPVATGMEVSLRLELPNDGARSAAVTAQGRINDGGGEDARGKSSGATARRGSDRGRQHRVAGRCRCRSGQR